ncbi:protein mono-ADP-ribosyltransferase PARP16-like isoform X3 [Euwallacea similis]|uniref:protein mono-ADP-ribosyltransferase PARP16-like isoform X3 n=1 Tax=Euwallacea similis TaxID=1736056 RepID=UPI00344CCD48
MEVDKVQETAVGELKDIVSKNLPGCDLTICIFIAALKSFRADQCLRPFPQCFINENNEKDFVSLKTACDKIPTLSELLKLHTIPKEVVDLLLWLFKDSGMPLFTVHPVVSCSTYSECKYKVHMFKGDLPLTVINKKASISTLPQYVFKEVIFGAGIYLSDEISVCTNYSPFGETWQNSTLGHKHSIIAICEVIDDEENVKCKDDKNKKRAINQNSYGEIPEKYFVVTNSELVKLKYLLVYRHKSPSTVTSFIKKNFLWLTIVLYFLMLILIGFFNNPYFQRYLRIIYSLFQ